ncbi:hypothetical protein [Candidatus Chloroploca asiatica]|uniref:Uncharacterized protein n=1 Tax=Candidatus Chloroploca asiatica TaxID=1506545 RepID=A0A2H3KGU3_9CHLR|nr:hypothetical protein [Candidatus Chloroploca asiatica]PDV96965.1 hypothetical protein A9Q02_05335 [Candidatus Chloroploca asiatica]
MPEDRSLWAEPPHSGGSADVVALEVPLLGVPLVVKAAVGFEPMLMGCFRQWLMLPAALRASTPPASLHLIVQDPEADEPDVTALSRFVVRRYGDTVVAARGSNLFSADLTQGVAVAFLTPALSANEAVVVPQVIEYLGLLLASRHDRLPVAAAGLVLDGTAVLLSGEAGLVSALTRASIEAAMALLAEQTVYLSLAHGLRVWGHASGGPGNRATHAERVVTCLVEQRTGQASQLERLEAALAQHELQQKTTKQACAALVEAGVYRLAVGVDMAPAVALLRHLASVS